MKLIAALAALLIAAGASASPAFARDSFVMDNAHLFSTSTVALINAKVSDFNAQTHKEVFVDTETTLDGTAQAAAEKVFAQQQVNGVLIFIAKSPKTIGVVPDRSAAKFFPSGTTSAIRQAIVGAFNSGDFNGGVTNGVDLTLSTYRSHLGSLRTTTHAYAAPATAPVAVSEAGGGFNMSIIFWLIALAVIFFVVRGIFRAISGPRMYPPGYGGGGPMGGPMGGGYGPGYGGGGFGGGGGFWSGMLGGLGGAFLGNELFGNRGGEMFNQGGGQQAGFNDGGQSQDNSGFQSDAGQADMGNSSFGSYGDSGGGGGWGGGDSGGGGGDFGGGGGDSGGW
jgi:uncharacterized membrane protein YgcG